MNSTWACIQRLAFTRAGDFSRHGAVSKAARASVSGGADRALATNTQAALIAFIDLPAVRYCRVLYRHDCVAALVASHSRCEVWWLYDVGFARSVLACETRHGDDLSGRRPAYGWARSRLAERDMVRFVC